MTRILFVCTGNICRSPTAEGVARKIAADLGVAEQFEFDSAGLESFHVGEAPDRRARARATLKGYDLSTLRARRVAPSDFNDFDLIVAMDRGHIDALDRLCPESCRHKIKLFMSYSDAFTDLDVPDPYYGRDKDFDRVLDMCEDAMGRLLK